eukprot:maker-scaffold100_size373717-snap-gene-2.45 protein:Tk05135 transcript:maker-scaffold100_size373717-snap-gene-2.45-mRNA-1 annotation:"serine proteinase-like protein 1"
MCSWLSVFSLLLVRVTWAQCPVSDQVDIRSDELFDGLAEFSSLSDDTQHCCCFESKPGNPEKCPLPTKVRSASTPPTTLKPIGPRFGALDWFDEDEKFNQDEYFLEPVPDLVPSPRIFLSDFNIAEDEEETLVCPPNHQLCCYDSSGIKAEVSAQSPLECKDRILDKEEDEEWVQGCEENALETPGKQCGQRPDFFTVPNLPYGMASPEEFPWICVIMDQANNVIGSCAIIPARFDNQIASGSEIVLTVAHRVSDYVTRPGSIKVRARDHYLCKDFQAPERTKALEFSVKEIIIHPEFSDTRYNNNLAALRLSTKIDLGQRGINAACLPPCNEMFDFTFQNQTGVRCWIAGWGRNRVSDKLQPYLRKVDIPLFDTNVCNQTITREVRRIEQGSNFVLDRGEICAGGEKNKDACNGDGGAPLVCQARSKRWYLVGLVAWGLSSKCGIEGIPGMYTRISNYRTWIEGDFLETPSTCCCYKGDPRDQSKCPRITKPTPSTIVGIRVLNGDLEPQVEECPNGRMLCCYGTIESMNEATANGCVPPNRVTPPEENAEWEQLCLEKAVGIRQLSPDKQCGERPTFYTIPSLPHGMASPEEFPWMCALFDRNNKYLCACVIVPEKSDNKMSRGTSLVLTVAHKAVQYTSSDLKVRVREHYLCENFRTPERQKFLEYDIDTIQVHPEYSPTRYNNNLAALRTKVRIDTKQSGVNAACLPTCPEMFDYSFSNGTGTRCWISGWGQDRNGNGLAAYLQKVDVPMYNNEGCKKRIRDEILKLDPSSDIELHPSELCAGGELNKDACNGDGGAPLVCQAQTGQWYVVGLVAWGVDNRCGEEDLPGIYVRLSHFKDWLDNLSSTSGSSSSNPEDLETEGLIKPRDNPSQAGIRQG